MIFSGSILSYQLTAAMVQLVLSLECLYVVTVAIFKISLGLFFLRLLTDNRSRLIIKWILILFSLFSTGYLFFAIFQCGIPRGSTFWLRKFAGQCASEPVGLGMGYIHAILTAGTDLMFLALTYPMIRNSQLEKREKVVVGFILCLATLYVSLSNNIFSNLIRVSSGCITSIIRFAWLPVLVSRSPDFFCMWL
jgi:hypothetical protein